MERCVRTKTSWKVSSVRRLCTWLVLFLGSGLMGMLRQSITGSKVIYRMNTSVMRGIRPFTVPLEKSYELDTRWINSVRFAALRCHVLLHLELGNILMTHKYIALTGFIVFWVVVFGASICV